MHRRVHPKTCLCMAASVMADLCLTVLRLDRHPVNAIAQR